MRNVTGMKINRIISLLWAMAAIVNVANSQGFAGPDVNRLIHFGDTIELTIGTPDGSYACYKWSGEHIISDPNQPTITIRVTHGEYNYTVTRISSNGYEEDAVRVSVAARIYIISVTPKYHCYNKGDYIFNEQFDIVTDPPGFGHLATVTPMVANIPDNDTNQISGNQEIKFSITYDDYTSEAWCYIFVVDPSRVGGTTQSFELMDYQSAFQNIKNAISRNFPTSRYDGTFSIPTIRKSTRNICCSNHTMQEVYDLYISPVSFGVSGEARFPFYGLPYVVSVDLVLGFSLMDYIGEIRGTYSNNTECTSPLCYSNTLSFSAWGGIGGSVLGGYVVAVDALIEGSASASATKCLGNPSTTLSLNGQVKLVGRMKLISLIQIKIEKPIKNITLSIDI